MKKYKRGEMVDTIVHGFVTVQCPITFKDNKNPKYDKLGGRTLYWLQDLEGEDIFLWENELEKILAEEELIDTELTSDESEYRLAGSDFEW